jgi:flagellar assembly factor FliW
MSTAAPASPPLVVDSTLLGRLEVPAARVLTFPAGLPGFEALRRFVLVGTQGEGLHWLQSVEDAALSFLLADPFRFVEGYAVEVPPADLAALGPVAEDAPPLVLAVAVIERGMTGSLNLQGPIVINPATRLARQVIFPDSPWGMAYPAVLG